MISVESIFSCLEQSPWYIGLHDRCCRLVWSNIVTMGLTPEIYGRPSDEIVHPEDRAGWRAQFMRVRDRREVIKYSLRIVVPEPPFIVRLDGVMGPVVWGGQTQYVLTLTEPRAVDDVPPAPAGEPPRPCGVPDGALWLSPLGERVVRHLAENPGWRTAEAIAGGVGETPGHRFRAALTGMADRRILEASSGNGYRLRD